MRGVCKEGVKRWIVSDWIKKGGNRKGALGDTSAERRRGEGDGGDG